MLVQAGRLHLATYHVASRDDIQYVPSVGSASRGSALEALPSIEHSSRKEFCMPANVFAIHPGLVDASRLLQRRQASNTLRTSEIAWLLGMGALAGLSASFLDFGWRIPGHAILRAVLPMTIGMALVPRRNTGLVMSAGAVMTLYSLRLFGGPLPGLGAGTSLLLLGPILDRAVLCANNGWRIYFGCAVAGFASNYAALVVRAAPKILGFEHGRGRPLNVWLTEALVTYALCGILAGLISACICFRARGSVDSAEPGTQP
jgi:hypothetical protein